MEAMLESYADEDGAWQRFSEDRFQHIWRWLAGSTPATSTPSPSSRRCSFALVGLRRPSGTCVRVALIVVLANGFGQTVCDQLEPWQGCDMVRWHLFHSTRGRSS